MSGSSKRLHEESAHTHFPPASKYPQHEDVSSASGAACVNSAFSTLPVPKPSSNSSECHPTSAPFDMSLDAPRVAKFPRTDSRDVDKRTSPLISMYRFPSSASSDMHSEQHPIPSEIRTELRDSLKDGSRDVKMSETSNRGSKADPKEYANRSEKDTVRFESSRTVDDGSKEAKYDREAHSADSKVDANAVNFNWKDPQDYYRGKRYPESNPSGGGGTESWHISRSTLHSPVEFGKEAVTMEGREYVEAHGYEAVGENKIDMTSEDKFKDREKKRKDAKHRDSGDKERIDRRANLQLGTSGSECRDTVKDDKEADKWEKERKDLFWEKDRQKEREKDQVHGKRGNWNGGDTESSQKFEKDMPSESIKKSEELESLGPEQNKNDIDSWHCADRETLDRIKEKDADAERERPSMQIKDEKESDDGCTNIDGSTEREREAFGYGIQQRKRMIRARGSPQMGSRFRSHTQDADGSQGKLEISTVMYKVGECMQELIKLWREHEMSQVGKNGESLQKGPTLDIRIPAEHVTATNRQVRGGQLWGTDVYTDDSDLVAVLMHTGYCRPTASLPPSAIHELRATVQVLRPQDCYVSTLRNNVRSRAWGAAIGCSYRVESCCIVKKGGGTIELEPCLTHSSAIEPTLAPVAVERTMTTRAAASNALRQQRFVREVTIQYNLCNEPWIKYSISIVADKGLKRPHYTSARLKKGEVLYLETHSCRYELCFSGEKVVRATAPQVHEVEIEKSQNHNLNLSNGEKILVDADNTVMDLFRFSRCKKLLPQKAMRSIGIPLPVEYLEVLEENLDWEDVQWSQTGVWIGGKEYPLSRVHFLSSP